MTEEQFVRKLTQLMDIRQDINKIPDNLQRFYKPLSSRVWWEFKHEHIDIIWVADADAVRAHFANRPVQEVA